MHVQFLLKTLAFTFGLVQAQNTSAPIVDLGYALHQGSAIKVCTSEGSILDSTNLLQ